MLIGRVMIIIIIINNVVFKSNYVHTRGGNRRIITSNLNDSGKENAKSKQTTTISCAFRVDRLDDNIALLRVEISGISIAYYITLSRYIISPIPFVISFKSRVYW